MTSYERRKRLLILVSGSPVAGGAERFCLNLASRIDRAMFEITVAWVWHFDSALEREYQTKLKQLGIAHYCCAQYVDDDTFRQNTLRGVGGFRKLLATLRPNIVNTHTEPADFCMAVTKLLQPILWVRTAHNTVEWPWAVHIGWMMDKICPVLCNLELAVSQAAARRLDQRLVARLLSKRARFAPNAVDAQAIRAGRVKHIRDELDIPLEAPLFGVAARMTAQKGIHYLLDAMPKVREHAPNAHLVIAGDGELLASLKQHASDNGLGTCVHFLGQRQDVLGVISALDVFVLPSLWEGLPTVILEAMALDIPVVATMIPGTDELVAHEKTGLLVPVKDSLALAQAMLRLYSDQVLAQSCTHLARKVVQTYSIDTVARTYEQIFLEL